MTSGIHPQHEKLLELAYGELSIGDASRLELHLKGCSRCAEAVSAIRRVRQTMSQLPTIQAPDRGLDSLLAYAGQAARRARSGAASTPTWWRRTLLPAAGLIALATVVVVGARVIKVANLSPSASEGDRAEAEHRTPSALQAQTSREERIEAKPSLKTEGSLYAAGAPRTEAAKQQDSAGAGVGSPPVVGSPYARVPAPERSDLSPEKKSRKRDEPPHRLAQHQAKVGKVDVVVEDDGVESGMEGGAVGGVVGGVLGGTLRESTGRGVGDPKAKSPAQVASAAAARHEPIGWSAEVGERSTAAAKAKDAGDRRREAVELQRALDAGAQGQERAGILNRLCDALYALGERAEAASVCDAVVHEFPNSPHATAALRRKALEKTAAPAEKIQPSAPGQPAKGKPQSEN